MLQIKENIGKTKSICICSCCGKDYIVASRYDAKKSPVGDQCKVCKEYMMTCTNLSKEKLHYMFNYSENTGDLIYAREFLRRKKGTLATFPHAAGYLSVEIGNKGYLAHRVIWLMKTGIWPNQIDHEDHNRSNNRWSNLRNVDNQANHQNESLSKNSTLGITGVCWHPPTNKYRAYIGVGHKQLHLGLFSTIDEAKNARYNANTQHNFHKNHGDKSCE